MPRKIPKWKFPTNIEIAYAVQLRRLVDFWEQIVKDSIFPQIDKWVQDSQMVRPKSVSNIKIDAWPAELSVILRAFRLSMFSDAILRRTTQEVQTVFTNVNRYNMQQFHILTKAYFGVPFWNAEPWLNETMNAFILTNVNRITKLTQDVANDVELVISQGIQAGLRAETIKKQLLAGTKLKKGVFSSVKKRANLIAKDQVSKANGMLSALRQAQAGVSEYIWQSSIDERVRTSHRAMQGKICTWDDPSVYKDTNEQTNWNSRSSIVGIELHPGYDYQCRCWAEPNFATIKSVNA